MKLFPDRLPDRLTRGLDRVYLIAGPEHLLVEEACDAVRAAARVAGIDERVVLEADARFDWGRLSAATETLSLFASRRLVEVRLASGKPGREGGAALREWIGQDGDDVLLVKCNAWDMSQERSAWAKALEGAGVYLPCWAVKAGQLPDWISRRLASRGLRADRAACRFLAERLEGNLLAAAQEIERLALLYGEGSHLGLDELRAAVADSARFDSFRLVELVLTGQAGSAVRCVRGLRETDTPMPMILSALARELQNLAAFQQRRPAIGEAAAFKELEVWRARQAPMAAAARRLDPAAVRSAVARLSDLDRMAKSNESHAFWVALERLCVEVAGTEPGRHAA
ncbi:DNA polymerase III subunit delta [Wenzhouxiangella limi]|uniref:DNA polymerase III subunit delta n=1 Tax=Wenzhouxiangella limi TaxID=2707351 RepID=A0A845V096_9GAMM|nr:DNA polymerase III subunit delta [Wenzhouxiangella limi]NDY96478.1 DNA polymerase III subunit delta [Wenzhouxiangella limi]